MNAVEIEQAMTQATVKDSWTTAVVLDGLNAVAGGTPAVRLALSPSWRLLSPQDAGGTQTVPQASRLLHAWCSAGRNRGEPFNAVSFGSEINRMQTPDHQKNQIRPSKSSSSGSFIK